MNIQLLGMVNPNQLNLTQLKQKLNYDDERKVKNWLEERNIPLKSDGRDKLVYEFNVDFVKQLELVDELKKQYPLKWHLIYQQMSTCEKMTNAIFVICPPTTSNKVAKQNTTIKKYIE